MPEVDSAAACNVFAPARSGFPSIFLRFIGVVNLINSDRIASFVSAFPLAINRNTL